MSTKLAAPVGEKSQLLHPARAWCICLVEVVEHHAARGEVGDDMSDGRAGVLNFRGMNVLLVRQSFEF